MQIIHRTNDGGILSAIPSELARYIHELKRLPTFFPLAFIAAAALWPSKLARTRKFKLLFSAWIGLAVANAFMAGKESGFYTVYPFVLLLSLISIGIAELWNSETSVSRMRFVLATIVLFGFGLNATAFTYGPRLLAFIQRDQRDYEKQFRRLSELLRPGDQVWGSASAWYAVVAACARLDAQPEAVPIVWHTSPIPEQHRFVITEPNKNNFVGFKKIGVFGSDLPVIFGSRLSNASYLFEMWESDVAAREINFPRIVRSSCPARR